MEVKESYRILELEIGASRAAVDAAYCRLIEHWHPDRAATGGPEAVSEAQRKVAAINDAYQTLVKIAPNAAESPASSLAKNPEIESQKPDSDSKPPATPPIAAPKPKPKLPALSANYLAGLPAPPRPPPPDTKTAESARAASIPPFASPPPASGAPPFAPAPNPAAHSPEIQAALAATSSDPLNNVSGSGETLFPSRSPLRRYAPGLLAVALFLVFFFGRCAFSSAPSSKSVSSPDTKMTGRLVVKSNLSNATVEATRLPSSDDASTTSVNGTIDHALSDLPPGKYAVTARVDGWPEIREEVKVEAEHTTEVAMNFKGGSLRLDSDPTGAKVRLGADMIGQTPLVIPQLPPGERQLFLEYPFWPAVPFKVTITENVEATATVRLPHGKLTVETSPPGTTVLLAGRILGQTPLTLARFPAGTRKLTLQAKDFPAMEVAVTLQDRGEVKLHPTLGSIFPVLDPAAVLRAIWVPDKEDEIAPPSDGVSGPYQARNGVVKNLNRKWLAENWLGKRYQFSGIVKSYDQASGQIEFVEQATPLSKYRVLVFVSPEARDDSALAAQLTKGASVAFYGRLSAVEEPRWPFKVITFEISNAEALR